jgi:LysR family hydrogen peroxide-inducible transcriptional activator
MASLTLKQLRYLVAVADTLHFRRAAEVTHVSQPTLSGQLQQLERRLGVELVERSRSKVILTPVGKEVVARARVVLRDIQDIVELARHGTQLFGGVLRLGVLPTLGPYLLPHILAELHGQYPALRLYVREGRPRALLDDLEDGSFDALMVPLPVSGADLRSARLFREPLLIATARDHPLASKAQVERSDLKGEVVLALERGHQLHDQVRELCAQFGATLSLDFEGTSLDTLRHMVAMGTGLSFLPALYVRSELAGSGEVVARPLRTRPPARTVGMVWRRRSARGEEFLLLASLIRRILRTRVPEVSVMG